MQGNDNILSINISDNKVEQINLEDQDAVWNSIQRNFQAIFDSPNPKMECRRYDFQDFYRLVYTMCCRFKNGRLVYNGVRHMIKQHIDKMQLISNFCLFLESNLQRFVDEGEFTLDYGWRLFRTELLENRQIKSALLADRLVLNPGNGIQANPTTDDDVLDVNDYEESPLFNIDTIIEILTFLSNLKLGLQISTGARQMAKLSDYMLNKRKPISRPIAIWTGKQYHDTEPFATHLQKEFAPLRDLEKVDNWYTSKAPEFRICLPDTEPPEWLARVELIYIMDGLNDTILRFLNALRDKLQPCKLVLNLGEFLNELHETGHLSQFFELFNERCISFEHELPSIRRNDKWPLWAIFNNIYFPNCRELTLLSFDMQGNEAAKWLMHPSTECGPRLLKFRSVPKNCPEFEVLLRHIKEDFFNPTGKRMLFVELPNQYAFALPAIPAWQQGEWQNGIGEQLHIGPTKITRLPKDQSQMEFKDFYDFPAVLPKLVFK